MKIKNAIFLDRDGTLNKGIIKENVDRFKLRPPHNIKELHIYEDIKILNFFTNKFYIFITTNQPDIKKGFQTKEFNDYINQSILNLVQIKKIYSCFCLESDPGCDCYKPSSGMILNAQKEFKIDIKNSYYIGDTWRDIGLCKKTGLTSILIDRGYYDNMKNDFIEREIKPDYKIRNFSELKNIINY